MMSRKMRPGSLRLLLTVLLVFTVIPAFWSSDRSITTMSDPTSAPTDPTLTTSTAGSSGASQIRTSAVRDLLDSYDYQAGLADWVTDSVALADGSVYIVGYTESFNLPVVGDEYSTSQSGDFDSFVLHLSASEEVISCTYFGGKQNDFATTIDYHNETDTVYIAGYTESNNESLGDAFPTTFGAYMRATPNSNFIGFIATFSSNLSDLFYCSYYGADFNERIFDMQVAESGLAVCVGETSTGNLPMEGTPENSTAGGAQDGFVMIHNVTPGDGDVPYSSYIGCKGTDIASAVTIIEENVTHLIRLAVAGVTNMESFNHKFTAGAYSNTFTEGGFTHWLIYQNFTGFSATIDYGTFLGEGGVSNNTLDYPKMDLDDVFGAVIVVASVTSDWPTAGTAPQVSYGGGSRDAWIAWIDSDGGAGASDLITATFWGGNSLDHAMDVAVSPNLGHVLVVGSSESDEAPIAGLRSTGLTGDTDAWVARFPRPSGRKTHLNYSTLVYTAQSSRFWTISADPRSDYPLCSGVETVSGSSTGQDIIYREVVLPTEPVLRVIEAPGEDEIESIGDRIVVKATVERGTNLSGSQLDSVSLVLVFANESTRWIDAEDEPGALYTIDTQLNSTEADVEAWYFIAISKDNGRSWDWANGTATQPFFAANASKPLVAPSLESIWGDYGMYIIVIITTIVAVLFGIRSQPNIIGISAGAFSWISLTWLFYLGIPGVVDPLTTAATYGYITIFWASAPLIVGRIWPAASPSQAMSIGLAIAFAILTAWTIQTVDPIPWTTVIVYGLIAFGGVAGAWPGLRKWIVAAAIWIASAVLAVLPAIAEGIVGLFGG